MKVSKFKIGVTEFIITECPKLDQMDEFKNIIIKNKVNILIRIVEKSLLYEINVPNLTVVDFTDFEDGSVPSKQIMDKYIKLIEDIKVKYTNPIVAIHCVSSLGRAPTFLGIYMIIENPKLDRYDMINLIRSKRSFALNLKQVNWLIDLKIPSKKKSWEFWKAG